MIAMSLNKTVESAFFDLFNKFFMKRGNRDVYRVAVSDGTNPLPHYNHNFNAVIVMSRDESCK
jgi:hypothetical protein